MNEVPSHPPRPPGVHVRLQLQPLNAAPSPGTSERAGAQAHGGRLLHSKATVGFTRDAVQVERHTMP